MVWRFAHAKQTGELFSLSALFLIKNSYTDEVNTSSCIVYRSTERYRQVVQFPRTREVHNVTATHILGGAQRDCSNFIYEDSGNYPVDVPRRLM